MITIRSHFENSVSMETLSIIIYYSLILVKKITTHLLAIVFEKKCWLSLVVISRQITREDSGLELWFDICVAGASTGIMIWDCTEKSSWTWQVVRKCPMNSRVIGYFLSCKNNVLCYSLLKRRQLISVCISLGRLREKFSRRKTFQFLDRCFLFHAIASLSTQSCSSCGGGLVAKSCPTLATPWTENLSGSSVHGILQARILE